MANYINNGSDRVFPTLMDADGNVLMVLTGATFTAPDGLVVDGIDVVTAKTKSAPVETVTDSADSEEN